MAISLGKNPALVAFEMSGPETRCISDFSMVREQMSHVGMEFGDRNFGGDK